MSQLRDLLDTVNFACLKHRDQRRKNKYESPYINHPIEVAHILAENDVEDLETLQAALLHDVLEDTDTTYEELEARFGRKVADVVKEVTDDKSTSKYTRKKAQLDLTRFKSLEARLVKLGDKISNTRDLKSNPPEGWSELQRLGYLHWSFAICLSILHIGDIPLMLEEFTRMHFEDLGVLTVDERMLEEYLDSLPK